MEKEKRNEAEETSKVVSALARLERVGAENSKATEKLTEAAKVIAKKIAAIEGMPGGRLPEEKDHDYIYAVAERAGGWAIGSCKKDTEDYQYSTDPDGSINYEAYDWGFTFNPSRGQALRLAELVASGWIDRLSAWIDSRRKKSEQALKAIENVKIDK